MTQLSFTEAEAAFRPKKEKWSAPLSPQTRKKLEDAWNKSLTLPAKEIRCPYCGYLAEVFYGNAGLFRLLCKRCGGTAIIDVACWRTRK